MDFQENNGEGLLLAISPKKLHDLREQVNALEIYLSIEKVNLTDYLKGLTITENHFSNTLLAVLVKQGDVDLILTKLSNLISAVQSAKTFANILSENLRIYDVKTEIESDTPEPDQVANQPEQQKVTRNKRQQKNKAPKSPSAVPEKTCQLKLLRASKDEIKRWIPSYDENENSTLNLNSPQRSKRKRKLPNPSPTQSCVADNEQDSNTATKNASIVQTDDIKELNNNPTVPEDETTSDPEFQVEEGSDLEWKYEAFGVSTQQNSVKSIQNKSPDNDDGSESDDRPDSPYPQLRPMKTIEKATKGLSTFPCTYGGCPIVLSSEQRLRLHLNIFHIDKVPEDKQGYRCPYCVFYIATEKKCVYTHIKKFHPGRDVHPEELESAIPFKCLICNKVFAFPCRLRKHQLSHERKKQRTAVFKQTKAGECEECRASFNKITNLEMHKQIAHLKRKQIYTCTLCPEISVNQWKLIEKHFKTNHPDDETLLYSQQYKCGKCDKSYVDEEYFNLHVKSHDTEPEQTNFPCNECGAIYEESLCLKFHQETLHQPKTYPCEFCPEMKPFKIWDHLVIHIQSEHKNLPSKYHSVYLSYNHTCEICNKGFVDPTYFKKHVKSHGMEPKPLESFSCDQCYKVLKTKQGYERHMEFHEQEKSKPKRESNNNKIKVLCTECGSFVVKLDTHIERVHLNLRPEKCHICPKSFYDKFKLKKHLTFHERRRKIFEDFEKVKRIRKRQKKS